MVLIQFAKWRNSKGVRIGKETLKSLGFNSKEIESQEIKFEMEIKDGQIILNLIKEMIKLDKLFVGFEGDPTDYKVSIDWVNPVGKDFGKTSLIKPEIY